MSSFEAVVDAVRDEGMSLRQQLASQAPEQESPAVRDAKEAERVKREEETNDVLQEILKSLGFGKKLEKDSGDKFSVLSTVFGFLVEGLAMSGIIAGIATLTNTDAIIKAFGLPKTFTNVIGALKLFKTITLLPFTLTAKVIDSIAKGIKGFITLVSNFIDLKFPKISLPEFKFPEFKFPAFKFPAFNLPTFKFPDLPTIPEGFRKTFIDPIKALIGTAGTPDTPGRGLLGFLNGLKGLIPGTTLKAIGLIGFGALKLLVGPFVQFFLSLFDFIGGVFKGADEAEKEKVGMPEKIRLMFVRGIEGIITGIAEALKLVFVDLTGWIAGKLGFKEFAAFLATIDVAGSITKSFDYLFGIGEYKEKGGLPSDIGKLFAETIPKALQEGKDKLSAIGDTIADLITSIGDWFKETFNLEKILANSPRLMAAAQKLGIIADPEEVKELESDLAEAQARLDRANQLPEGEYRRFDKIMSAEQKVEEAQKKLDEAARMRKGGITTQSGLVNIHPQEAVIPLEKMDEVINKINTAALSKTGGAGAPVQINNVTSAPVDASSSSVTHAAALPMSPPTNYNAIL